MGNSVNSKRNISVLMMTLAFTSMVVAGTRQAPLKVGTLMRKPFAFKRGEVWTGYSIDLLNQISADIEREVEIVESKSISDLLEQVASGDVDLAISNISITSDREAFLDFSHPIYSSGLQLAVPTARRGSSMIPPGLFSRGLMRLLLMASAVLLLVAHGLWYFERGSEKDFRDSYIAGIWDAFWWAAVTVTTVGYGDSVPRSYGGRIVALLWMFSSLFLVTVFVAHATNVFSHQTCENDTWGVQSLENKTVVTVRDSTAERYLLKHGVNYRTFDKPELMFSALESGDADMLVYDAPLVFHRAKDSSSLRPTGPNIQSEDFGIAFPTNSPLRERINSSLLAMKELGVTEEIRQHWFD